MFGLFSSSKRRVPCAFCESELEVKVPKDLSPVPCEFSVKLGEISRTTCPTCKRQQVIVVTANDTVDACDLEWEMQRHKLQTVIDRIEAQISVLAERRKQLEISPAEFEAGAAPLRSTLKKAEARYRKDEAAYEAARQRAAGSS